MVTGTGTKYSICRGKRSEGTRFEASILKPPYLDPEQFAFMESNMRDFHNLDAWAKAHRMTLAVYQLTEGFPPGESFGLVLSLRRSAANVSMKIADACGRDDGEAYATALRHARGLGTELEYLFLLAFDLGLIDPATHESLKSQVVEVRRMLSGVIKRHSIAV